MLAGGSRRFELGLNRRKMPDDGKLFTRNDNARGTSAAVLLGLFPLLWYNHGLPNQDRRMRIRVVLLRCMDISAARC